jgi:gliding motility-associated-like protein
MRGWKKMLLAAATIGWVGCGNDPFAVETSCSGSDFTFSNGETMVFIPAVFSPNGDGINDRFQAFTKGVDGYDMKIYNRYGTLFYHSISQEDGWDGTYRGKKVPQGDYFAAFQFQVGEARINRAVTFSMYPGPCVPAGLKACQYYDQADTSGETTRPTREKFCE